MVPIHHPAIRQWQRAMLGCLLSLIAASMGLSSCVPVQQPARPATQFVQVQAIIARRCSTCHAAIPRNSQYIVPPAGITFDTPEQIATYSAQIHAAVVITRRMPLGNMTMMTEEERAIIAAWIAEQAPQK